jgi:hypothetical protein
MGTGLKLKFLFVSLSFLPSTTEMHPLFSFFHHPEQSSPFSFLVLLSSLLRAKEFPLGCSVSATRSFSYVSLFFSLSLSPAVVTNAPSPSLVPTELAVGRGTLLAISSSGGSQAAGLRNNPPHSFGPYPQSMITPSQERRGFFCFRTHSVTQKIRWKRKASKGLLQRNVIFISMVSRLATTFKDTINYIGKILQTVGCPVESQLI